MKKRIVCVLLTLIMLVGMLPLSASAAGQTISERAITVLKQMQNYSKTCKQYGSEWRNGYGTICTESGRDHSVHSISEEKADKALRNKLTELEAAVNAAGFSLSQNQFDALVVLTYDVGTSWLSGTGVLKSAVTNKLTGNAFLNAIGQTSGYNSGATWKLTDEQRRMVEANMYLNGSYSNVAPSNYTYVDYVLDDAGAYMAEGTNGQYRQYFDKSLNAPPAPVPTLKGKIFLGWYMIENGNEIWVPHLSTYQNERVLHARWQTPGIAYTDAKVVYNWQYKGLLANTNIYDNPKSAKVIGTHTNENVIMDRDYIDANGNRWGRLQNGQGWVLISGTAASNQFEIDVTVTVTNSTLNRRVNASTSSGTNGSYKMGDKLRIVNTEMGSGLLWGQVADENGTELGWVALMYTNWNEVKDNPAASNTNNKGETDVIATAVVNCDGYLNIRSAAGTDNAIVGALADGDHVEIYEIKFVNGHQWGRMSEGWILLTYAKVDMQDTKLDISVADDVLAYTYTGTLKNAASAHAEPTHLAETVGKEIAAGTLVAISMVKNDESGKVWGFNGVGWLPLESVIMDVAKYVVVSDSVSVRSQPNSSSNTVEKVVKGVELDISDIAVVDATIWGKTEKYSGWVNLASKYVQRSNAPIIENVESNKYDTGLIATVINTGSVNVRVTTTASSAKIGSLPNGTTMRVWEVDEDEAWYKVDSNLNGDFEDDKDGWVSGQYLNVRYGTIGGNEENTNGTTGTTGTGTAAIETGLGVVANTYTGVNIRQGAGTGYATNGKYLTGTAVEILEVTETATAKWGRTEKGWVCMDYVTMISKYAIGNTADTTPEKDPNAGQNTGGSTSTTEGNTTISSTPAIYAGIVVGSDVPVRKTADDDAIEIATLANGQNITIQELVEVKTEVTVAVGDVVDGNANTQTFEKTITTSYWARVNGGWVKDPAANLQLNSLDERTYTVVDYAEVNVRDSAAGTIITDIDKGTQVAITTLEIVNDKVWGYAEDLGNGGWIRLDTLAEGAITINTAPETTAPTTPPITMGNGSDVGGYVNNAGGYRYTGTVINTDAVNVRALPSTGSNVIIQLKYGQSLVIYETTIAENMAWGRCDAGWVYLYYVDLVPVVNGAVDARVVYNDNTIIYSDVNCSSVAGTYARMSVIDIYEVVGDMARTDKGWVKTTDLL